MFCIQSQVVSWYTWRARHKMLRNITLPFAELATKPNSQIFPCSVLQGLRFHPWVRSRSQELLVDLLKAPGQTEFNSLVKILTDNDVAGGTPGSTDQVKVGVLGSSSKKLLENQRLQNWMKELIHQNNRLMTNKRKSEEMSIGWISQV